MVSALKSFQTRPLRQAASDRVDAVPAASFSKEQLQNSGTREGGVVFF